MYIIGMIAAASIVTIIIRFLPFWIFRNRSTPPFIEYLGRVLPYAIMGMLVVYCLRQTDIRSASHGIPEAIGVLVTAGVQVLKRNSLLSILAGTVCYMFLIQVIF